ncbi:MAG: glycosyltransferase family protein [Thermoplasmataceae archaeon]
MEVGIAVHGWYHPLMETDTYISSIEESLSFVGIVPIRIRGHNIPNGTISQLMFPPILKYFMNYGKQDFDIIHDTRGDSVFRNVDVSTITDLYWNQYKMDLTSNFLKIPIRLYQNYRRTLRLSKRVIILNSIFKKEINQFFGSKYNDKIKVIPVPFDNKSVERNNSDKYDVIWVGSTDKRKQLPIFLDCVRCLPKSYNIAIKATRINRYISDNIIEIDDKIKAMRKDGRSIDVLRFTKSWGSLNDLYLSSKCLVSTSSYEGFHMPVAEAYLRGCHVVLPRSELYSSIYGDAEGVHYYNNKDDFPMIISEAVQYGRFKPDQQIVNYLSFNHVGSMLKDVYEEAMRY